MRFAAAVIVAGLAIALKGLMNAETGGNLGYLSYVSGIILAAWIAGSSGGLLVTAACSAAELLLFNNVSDLLSLSSLAALRLALFVTNGVVLALITSRLREAVVREQLAREARDAQLIVQQQARTGAERDRARLARLHAVTESLAGAASPGEVADAILDRGLRALGALAGVVFRVDTEAPGATTLMVLASRGYPDDPGAALGQFLPAQGRYTPEPRTHVSDALARGQPIFLDDPGAWAERYPDSPPFRLPGSPAGGSLAVLPMGVAERVVGVVIFRFAAHREFSDGTADLAVRLADQGAVALDRALARHEEQVAFRAVERAKVRLTFVARASERIMSASSFTAGAASVPREAVPDLADWCQISLIDADHHVLATAGTSAATERAVEHLAVVTASDLGAALAGDEATAQPQVIRLDEGWSRRLGDRRTVAVMAELGTAVVLIAPILSTHGDRLGSLVMGSTAPDGYDPDDLAMSRDVATRIAVAAERTRLFAAVARFKANVDASADAVYMFDPLTFRVTYANRGGADLAGLEPAEVEQGTITDLLASSDEAAFHQRLADLRASPSRVLNYTDVLAQKGDRRIPVDVMLQEVILPDGSPTAILTARDMSDRIDVQARLARIAGDERRQAAELRAVIRSMGDGVLVVDVEGRITLANEAAFTILDGAVPERLPTLETWLGVECVAADGTSDEGDGGPRPAAPVTVQTGGGRWLEVATYATDPAGAPLNEGRASRIVVLRDVTRVREAAAAQEAFLGVLSHELRTPITTIFGYAKVLQRPSHEDERETMLRHIEVESDRLYRIVEDLLALSRVEGGITIEGEPLLVQYLIDPVIGSESPRWIGIEFETDLPLNLPVVWGERTYVEQVLRNLITNAAKYSQPGTSVTITVEPTPTEVLVRVLDRGIGIDKDEADRLFELYYRSPGTARKAAGSGIGLYICRGLINAMGGRIWAQPRPGGGSEFGFSLPRVEDDAADPDTGSAA